MTPTAARVPRPWTEAESDRVALERAAMQRDAPDLHWSDDLVWLEGRRASGWSGAAPAWGGDRPEPPGVEALLGGRRLQLVVIYPEAFPAVPPSLFPINPEVPWNRRTLTRWHVLGDGALCLTRAAHDWEPATCTAADLVRKAAGWFIEYQLMEVGLIDAMTERGVAVDESLDTIIARAAT